MGITFKLVTRLSVGVSWTPSKSDDQPFAITGQLIVDGMRVDLSMLVLLLKVIFKEKR